MGGRESLHTPLAIRALHWTPIPTLHPAVGPGGWVWGMGAASSDINVEGSWLGIVVEGNAFLGTVETGGEGWRSGLNASARAACPSRQPLHAIHPATYSHAIPDGIGHNNGHCNCNGHSTVVP